MIISVDKPVGSVEGLVVVSSFVVVVIVVLIVVVSLVVKLVEYSVVYSVAGSVLVSGNLHRRLQTLSHRIPKPSPRQFP